jgi:hypothetical protein
MFQQADLHTIGQIAHGWLATGCQISAPAKVVLLDRPVNQDVSSQDEIHRRNWMNRGALFKSDGKKGRFHVQRQTEAIPANTSGVHDK